MSGTAAPNRQRTVGTRPSVRDLVLDVALDLHADGRWERTAMREIAAAAGVTRQTLYNQFGGRNGVTQALLRRETDRLLDGVDQRWRQVRESDAEAGDCLAAAMSWLLAASHSHPLLRDGLTGDGPGPAGTSCGRGRAGVITELYRRLVDAVVTGGQPAHPDQLQAVETVVRMTLSYLLIPSESHQQARSQIVHAARASLPDSRAPARAPTSGATGGRAGARKPSV
ncbi:TetR/AcrR family transcriptional regulator [Streptomyces sp. NPDC050535]|uniref:TetR/AcrR family transcriptional regulator n=1 Tax=Streptomyces sp. NPDC050535 TaxID=3365626 RepID=UPI0037AB2904